MVNRVMVNKNARTHVLSDMERSRGEYCETGRDDLDGEGDPNPDIPDTLYRLLIVGRGGGGGGGGMLRDRFAEALEGGTSGGVAFPYPEEFNEV
jgi:hypothetical protein